MFRLFIHEDAESDLEALWDQAPQSAARITVLFEDLENEGMRYRIVYAFVPGKGHYHVLGIVPREFNYDAGHQITRRILAAYEVL